MHCYGGGSGVGWEGGSARGVRECMYVKRGALAFGVVGFTRRVAAKG